MNAQTFINTSRELLSLRGPDPMMKYIGEQLSSGLELGSLRELVRTQNPSGIQEVAVSVHPEHLKMVPYANRLLADSGMDFIRFVAVEDATLPDPTRPFQEDEASYKAWKKTRAIIAPVIGLATTLVVSTGLLEGGLQGITMPDQAKLIPAIAQGLVVMALELQFAAFSGMWNKNVWSQDHLPAPVLSQAQLDRIHKGYHDLTELTLRLMLLPKKINQVLDQSHLKASYFYNYLVNYIYSGIVYAAGYGAALASGIPWEEKGLGAALLDNVIITTAFWFSFGLNQVLSGELLNRGLISERRRYQIEASAFYLAAPARVLSLIPEYMNLGIGLQLLAGAALTVPNILKLSTAPSYGAYIGEQSESAPKEGLCQAVLRRAYTAFPWISR